MSHLIEIRFKIPAEQAARLERMAEKEATTRNDYLKRIAAYVSGARSHVHVMRILGRAEPEDFRTHEKNTTRTRFRKP